MFQTLYIVGKKEHVFSEKTINLKMYHLSYIKNIFYNEIMYKLSLTKYLKKTDKNNIPANLSIGYKPRVCSCLPGLCPPPPPPRTYTPTWYFLARRNISFHSSLTALVSLTALMAGVCTKLT